MIVQFVWSLVVWGTYWLSVYYIQYIAVGSPPVWRSRHEYRQKAKQCNAVDSGWLKKCFLTSKKMPHLKMIDICLSIRNIWNTFTALLCHETALSHGYPPTRLSRENGRCWSTAASICEFVCVIVSYKHTYQYSGTQASPIFFKVKWLFQWSLAAFTSTYCFTFSSVPCWEKACLTAR